MERHANEDSKQDVAQSAKTIKVECAEDIGTKFLDCPYQQKNIFSNEHSNVDKPCRFSEFVGSAGESAIFDESVTFAGMLVKRTFLLFVASAMMVQSTFTACVQGWTKFLITAGYVKKCMLSEVNEKMNKSSLRSLWHVETTYLHIRHMKVVKCQRVLMLRYIIKDWILRKAEETM
ncbi:uncharacterized protein [Coffea arabica]|uniref:Uncharacterized protein n=1 Tax=Coffea arabica TaxID=13443 RepID=A0ABM4VRT0_COFAR